MEDREREVLFREHNVALVRSAQTSHIAADLANAGYRTIPTKGGERKRSSLFGPVEVSTPPKGR